MGRSATDAAPLAAVAAPPGDAPVATLALDGQRYVLYALDALLVVLRENHARAIPGNARSEARRVSTLDLWQTWDAPELIRDIAPSPVTRRAVRGALALALADGRVVLLTPTTMTNSHYHSGNMTRTTTTTTAAAAAAVGGRARGDSILTTASALASASATATSASADYAKLHLHLQLPTWREATRWRGDDRRLDRVAWVEGADDVVWLVGAGPARVTVWRLVPEDAGGGVVAFLHLGFALAGPDRRLQPTSMTMMPPLPPPTVTTTTSGRGLFDVTPSGRFVATAAPDERLVTVWALQDLGPDGRPLGRLLAHGRALVRLQWATGPHAYRIRGNSAAAASSRPEMLYALDRAGVVTIWRENVAAQSRSFTRWRRFSTPELLQSSAFGVHPHPAPTPTTASAEPPEPPLRITAFGLVSSAWGRPLPQPTATFADALLDESNVLSALSTFHYGYTSLDDVRRNELVDQRMEGLAKINAKSMGDRCGAIGDTHAGETLIVGNAPLQQTFVVHLAYGVHENGDLGLYRIESIQFSGVAPRVSLLTVFTGMREQLASAKLHEVCSQDFKDRENGAATFILEILYQSAQTAKHLKFARLKLQAESGAFGGARSSRALHSYSVQMCEVGDASASVLGAWPSNNTPARLDLNSIHQATYSATALTHDPPQLLVSNASGTQEFLRVSNGFRPLKVSGRPTDHKRELPANLSRTVWCWQHNVLFTVSRGQLTASVIQREGTAQVSSTGLIGAAAVSSVGSFTDYEIATKPILFEGEDGDTEDVIELILVGVSPEQKDIWSSAPTSIFAKQSSEPTQPNDFCILLGLVQSGSSATVWVISFPLHRLKTAEDVVMIEPLQLFRRYEIRFDHSPIVSIASVPSTDQFTSLFCTIDTSNHLKLWTFADMDDLSIVREVHSTDMSQFLRSTNPQPTAMEHMNFFVPNEQYQFSKLAVSKCGRVATLFRVLEVNPADKPEGQSVKGGIESRVCIASLIDHWHEAVVTLKQDKFGTIEAIEWSTTEIGEAQLVFLSQSSAGIIRIDETQSDNPWAIVWSSNRFSSRPRLLAPLPLFPRAFVGLDPGVACCDIQELSGPSAANSPNGFDIVRTAIHPMVLTFLLMRGSFRTLDQLVRHLRSAIADHEKMCYLRMTEDKAVDSLPFLKLSSLVGDATDDYADNIPSTYRARRESSAQSRPIADYKNVARASDLFASSTLRTPSEYTHENQADRAENLFAFASRKPAEDVSPTSIMTLKNSLSISSLETSQFFIDHKSMVTFLRNEDQTIFLSVLAGCRRIIPWEDDLQRGKDEPALRFCASLIWPYKLTDEATPAIDCQVTMGICSEQIAWAAISAHQNELLQECVSMQALTLKEFTALRLPFWVQSVHRLSQYTEKVAQVEYASTRDPFRVALLYILLGKCRLLVSLFKMGNEPKIADLLGNDFHEERWKNAAVKNAYVLKAKRRYELSASFFLLGGKTQEAVAVMELEDTSLVMPFLIARLSEKWDLNGGCDGTSSASFGASEVSLSGLSTNLRIPIHGDQTENDGTNAKGFCKEYLKTTILTRAQTLGDIYMSFLVHYYVGERDEAFRCLLKVPTVEMRCVFDPPGVSEDMDLAMKNLYRQRQVYWRVICQSLVGATDLIRCLKPTIRPLTETLKVQILRVQTLSLNRLMGTGWTTLAFFQQRDFAGNFKQFCKASFGAHSAEKGLFLSERFRTLSSVLCGQAIALAHNQLRDIKDSLDSPSESRTLAEIDQMIQSEIRSVINYGKSSRVDGLDQSLETSLEAALQQAVYRTLHQYSFAWMTDFVNWHPNPLTAEAEFPQQPGQTSNSVAITQLLEVVVDGISVLGSGDLDTSGSNLFHSKRIDQTFSEMLDVAERLLYWLTYLYSRPPDERKLHYRSGDYVRVVTAAVYSVIGWGCRYLKSPCCLHRALTVIYPHMDALPSKVLEDVYDISNAKMCLYCTISSKSKSEPQLSRPTSSSLQRDIPALHQTIQILKKDFLVFTEDVKTNRFSLSALSGSQFTYCPYWTMVLSFGASKMGVHITKVAIDGSNPSWQSTSIARRMALAWSAYATNLSKYSSRTVLYELIETYYRPFEVRRPSTPTGRDASTGGSNVPSSMTNWVSGAASSPHPRDRRESRQLLACCCDRCPWLPILSMFVDRDELLLRINTLIECCGEKIKESIAWGNLPDFPSKRTVLTRSQRILLSSAAGKAADLTDLMEKRMQSSGNQVQVDAQCLYRSEVSIKSMCFNRSTDSAELVLCSSKGLCRTASVEYSDGTKYQFKGIYANPPTVSSDSSPGLPTTRRRMTDGIGSVRSGTDSPQKESVGAGDAKTPNFKPSAVTSHPYLPLFVSGNQKGRVHLWSFDSLSSVCEFQTRDVVASFPLSGATSSRRDIKKIQIDSFGQQMGAVDNCGRLYMWKFTNLERESCYRQLDCHDKGAKGLKFINSGSVVATCGSSTDKRSVCMWDLLLPASKSQIAAPSCHPAGAASLAFSPTHQLLISGGEGGSISVFDVRQRRVLHTVSNAHETAITTLEVHPSGRCVISGSASGDIKIWSLPIFREIVAIGKVHAKPSFLGDAASNLLGDAASNMAINVTSSSWGVTDAMATDGYFFTSGTDGSVQRFRIPTVGKLW